jgi:hypothetical protein
MDRVTKVNEDKPVEGRAHTHALFAPYELTLTVPADPAKLVRPAHQVFDPTETTLYEILHPS